MDISMSARMKKSPEPFFAASPHTSPRNEQRRFYGRSLLMCAIANAVGRTPIDIADRLPHRTAIADRMKEYVREHA